MKIGQVLLMFIFLFGISYFLIYEREPLQSIQFSLIMSGLFMLIRR